MTTKSKGGGSKKSASKKKADPKTSTHEAAGAKDKKVIGLIGKETLKKLADRCLRTQNEMSNMAGEMGADIKEQAEKKNLHRGSFSDIKKLYRMGKKDPAKLWLHLAHFDHMREALDLDKMASAQGQLLEPGTDEEQEEPTGTFGEARTVSETAGESTLPH